VVRLKGCKSIMQRSQAHCLDVATIIGEVTVNGCATALVLTHLDAGLQVLGVSSTAQ